MLREKMQPPKKRIAAAEFGWDKNDQGLKTDEPTLQRASHKGTSGTWQSKKFWEYDERFAIFVDRVVDRN
jgi:hypothetical protein